MMTREEAINWIADLCDRYSKQAEEYEKQGALIPMDAMYPYIQALGVVLSALRPVSREQVEKAWRGEWIVQQGEHSGLIKKCSKCGFPISGWWDADMFCANCGAPMTDEAVDILLKRLEALYEIPATT